MKIPDFSIPDVNIEFGKTSSSKKPKRECPKCKNTVMIECIGIKEYKCNKCGKTWEEK